MTETKITAREVYGLQKDLDSAEVALRELAEEEARAQRAGAWISSGDYLRSPEGRAVEALRARVSAAQEAVGGVVYRIPGPNVGVLTEKLTKLAKRASKLGVGDVTFYVDPEVEVVESKIDPLIAAIELGYVPKTTRYRFVVLNAGVVKLSGWVFLATLTVESGGVMISKVPAFARAWQLHREAGGDAAGYVAPRDEKGDEATEAAQRALDAYDLGAYRDEAAAARCDHCGTVRRRTKTYLVESVETGEVKVVGSNCLRDFLGTDPARIAKYATYLADIVVAVDEESGWLGSGGEGRETDTEEFLTHVCAMIRVYGWSPASNGHETPTKVRAWSNLRNYGKTEKGQRVYEEVTEADVERAKDAIEWGRTVLAETARSDFDQNLVVAAKGEYVPKKGDGVLAYLPVAHARYQEREIERAVRAKADEASEWVGNVKDRVTVTARVMSVYEYAGDYGPTFITKLRDESGNVFKWFGSYDLGRGSLVTAKWTVKGHEEFKGTKETVLTRPAKVEIVEAVGPDGEPVEVPFREGDRVRVPRATDAVGTVIAVNLVAGKATVEYGPDEAPITVPWIDVEPVARDDGAVERENVGGLNVPGSYR